MNKFVQVSKRAAKRLVATGSALAFTTGVAFAQTAGSLPTDEITSEISAVGVAAVAVATAALLVVVSIKGIKMLRRAL